MDTAPTAEREVDPLNDSGIRSAALRFRPFVHKVARTYYRSGLGVDYEDLVQEGFLGLLEALRRWDPNRGVRFLTYAVWWVRKHILLHLSESRQNIRVPASRRDQARRAEQLMAHELGMNTLEPTLLGELPLPGEDHLSQGDSPFEGPEREVFSRECVTLVRDSLQTLPQRLQRILILRYGLDGNPPRTLRESAALLELSRERIRQLEARALGLLRRALPPLD